MNRMTSEKARYVRAAGHADAREFARLIGLPADYQNDPRAKKDVIDLNGDAHSVKSGKLKWQIFLYKKSRFETDPAFRVMNGVGAALAACLGCHPEDRADYKKDDKKYKEALRPEMRNLRGLLESPERRRAFFGKSFFNGDEVQYLTIKHGGVYHIFSNRDVVETLGKTLNVKNSEAKTVRQTPEQKVVFFADSTVGEIEIRRDPMHYVSAKFWMFKEKTLTILQRDASASEQWAPRVIVYGEATKKFKRKHKDFFAKKANAD